MRMIWGDETRGKKMMIHYLGAGVFGFHVCVIPQHDFSLNLTKICGGMFVASSWRNQKVLLVAFIQYFANF